MIRSSLGSAGKLTGRPLEFYRICLAVGVLVFVGERALAIRFPLGWLDSDDSVVGLMASDVASGRGHVTYPILGEGDGLRPGVPLYFYGQPYHGAGSALLAGVLASAAPIEPALLVAVVGAEACLLLTLLACLARRRLGDRAAALTVLLVALAPPYLVERTIRPAGNYTELLLVIVGVLSSLARPLACGALLGLGLWSNPLSLIAAPFALLRARDRQSVFRLAAGFGIGAIPVWISCLRDGWAPLLWLAGASGAPDAPAATSVSEAFTALFTHHLPTLIGVTKAFGRDGPLSAPEECLVMVAGCGSVVALIQCWRARTPRGAESLCGQLLGIAVFNVLLASLTRFRTVIAEPRYFVPLYLAWSVGSACLFERIRPPRLRGAMLAVLLSIQAHGHAAMLGERISADDRMEAQARMLEGAGVTRARAPYWIGYRLTFASRERIVAAPIAGDSGIRVPRLSRMVESAGRCAAQISRRTGVPDGSRTPMGTDGETLRVRGVYDTRIPLAAGCHGAGPT